MTTFGLLIFDEAEELDFCGWALTRIRSVTITGGDARSKASRLPEAAGALGERADCLEGGHGTVGPLTDKKSAVTRCAAGDGTGAWSQ